MGERRGTSTLTLEELRSRPWLGDGELTAFVEALERAFVTEIDPATESRHMAMIADELIRVGTAPAETQASWLRASWLRASWLRRSWNTRRLRLAFQLVTAMAMGSVFLGGLAVAGSGSPEANSSGHASDRATEATSADRGANGQGASTTFVAGLLDYIQSTTDEGCEFGQGVAAIASQGRGGNSDACTHANDTEDGGNNGAGSSGNTPKGSRATGEQHSAGSAGGAGAQGGRATGEERSGGKAQQGPPIDPHDAGTDNAGSTAQGGRATGEEHSGRPAGDLPGADDLPAADNATQNPSSTVGKGRPEDS